MNKQTGERIDNQTTEVIEIRDKDVHIVKYLCVVYSFPEKHKQYPYNHGSKHVVSKILE
jgi:hypothetical protein